MFTLQTVQKFRETARDALRRRTRIVNQTQTGHKPSSV